MKSKFVKADSKGKKNAKIVHNAIKEGRIDAYVKHPQTGKPIKLPAEIAKRIASGEVFSLDYILNFKALN